MKNLKQVFKKKKTKYKTLSPLEAMIVDELLKYDGLEFEANYKVGPYFVDIAFPKYKVALEIDGRVYHTTEEQITKDTMRQEYLETVQGWRIERIAGWFCKRHPDITVAKVLRHVPEVQEHPLYLEACIAAKQWYARDLINSGYKRAGIKILTDLSV